NHFLIGAGIQASEPRKAFDKRPVGFGVVLRPSEVWPEAAEPAVAAAVTAARGETQAREGKLRLLPRGATFFGVLAELSALKGEQETARTQRKENQAKA